MTKTLALLLTTLAATTAMAQFGLPFNTDEARADAAKRTATPNRAASLQPFVLLESEAVPVTDTDSARRAAGQVNARQAHDAYLSDVRGAGAGPKPVTIRVIDTDSARAAAAQERRASSLAAVYADYVKMLAPRAKRELSSASTSTPTSAIDITPLR